MPGKQYQIILSYNHVSINGFLQHPTKIKGDIVNHSAKNVNDLRGYWSGKKCLVTGGYGFGGSHLAQQLIEQGANVFILDRESPRNSYLTISGLDNRTRFIPGDIRDLGLIKTSLDRFDIHTVFHLAAQPIVPVCNSSPLESLSINVWGTYSILEAVRTST